MENCAKWLSCVPSKSCRAMAAVLPFCDISFPSSSSAASNPGKRPTDQAQGSSSEQPQARASPGSHQPEQAQGQVSRGLQPEGGDISADFDSS
ncbi:hypothetical protein Pyn_38654 [Prunus yedoensis var. nudiflora]|uniref:Uncharacterized protein n=1 Tax=Prunus yedoensis var. nudiflora TaxID=2094558 RepID=A0A314YH15_PRUYE|nr:hypothetical protein Pyn_38654 [Prunus yedoensis var. nudiflora]